MTNPEAAAVWEFGTIAEESFTINPDNDGVLAFKVDTSADLTCAFIDSIYNNLYDEDDWCCFWNKLTRGPFCGCTDISKTKALLWTQRTFGILSALSSLLIIVFVLCQEKKKRWTTVNQFVAAISSFDFLGSMAFAPGTIPVPKEYEIYGASGNEATCRLQGFVFQAAQDSMYYNLALTTYFLLTIKYSWTERKFSKVTKWVHLGVNVLGICIAFGSIPFHLGDYRWCYIQNPPYAPSWVPGILLFILPVSLVILAITVLTAILVRFVWTTERVGRRRSMNPADNSLAKRMFWHSLLHLSAFISCGQSYLRAAYAIEILVLWCRCCPKSFAGNNERTRLLS